MHAIQFGELAPRFALAVEKLHDGHAADVLVQKRVDARDRGSNSPVPSRALFRKSQVETTISGSTENVASANRQFIHSMITTKRPAETRR